MIPENSPFNRIDVINTADEFVFAGNNVAPTIHKASETGSCLVPDREPSGHGFSLVFEGPGSVFDTPEGKVFAPDSTHFGHSMKFYTNWLRDIGFSSVIDRTLRSQGGLDLPAIIHAATGEGELRLPGPAGA